MSVREANTVPNLPQSTGAQDPSTAGSSHVDASVQQTDDTQQTGEAAAPAPSMFWEQTQAFHRKEAARRRAVDKTIGDNTVAGAGPLDSDGGTQVISAAGKAGMIVPSKQMLSKVASAVKDNPKMAALQTYVANGLSGADPSFNTPAGAQKVLAMAADVGISTGLIHSTTGAAFGASSAGQPANNTSQPLATLPDSGNTNTRALTLVGSTGASLGDSMAPVDATGSTVGTETDTTATEAAPATPLADPTTSDSYLAGSNLLAIVMLACEKSMDEDSKIKLGRLMDMQKANKISELISGYISDVLQPAQAAMDKKTAGKKGDDVTNARVSVDKWSNVDPDNLFKDSDGNLGLSKTVTTERMSSVGLSTELTAKQQLAQTSSNNSEQYSNRFQATDSQYNQKYTMLTGFLKLINDCVNAILRNLA